MIYKELGQIQGKFSESFGVQMQQPFNKSINSQWDKIINMIENTYFLKHKIKIFLINQVV